MVATEPEIQVAAVTGPVVCAVVVIGPWVGLVIELPAVELMGLEALAVVVIQP